MARNQSALLEFVNVGDRKKVIPIINLEFSPVIFLSFQIVPFFRQSRLGVGFPCITMICKIVHLKESATQPHRPIGLYHLSF